MCTHEETVAVVKPWEDIGSNRSLGGLMWCVYARNKQFDHLFLYFYNMLLRGQFWVENESKVPVRIREGDVVRIKSNRVREGNGGRFQGRRKGKKRASVLSCLCLSWFIVIHVFMSSVLATSSLVRSVTSPRRADFWSCVSSAKNWWFTAWLVMILEGSVVYRTKRRGPEVHHTVHELWWWRRGVIDWSGLISVWEMWLKPLECSKLNAKNRVQAGEENLVVSSVKSCRKIEHKKNRYVVIVQSGENIVYNT